jgi:hypothetical protein
MKPITPCRLSLLVLAVFLTALGAACSSHSQNPDNVVQAGQLDIQLPPGWKVTHNGVIAPSQPAAAPAGATAARAGSTTTLPLNKQNPTTEFFQATSMFSSCLHGLGVTFVGAPNPNNPTSPANDPGYLKSLQKCAAQSNIIQALKDFQASQDNLTPKQIQQENQQYLRWRTCMVGRGWTVPQPTPDSKGRLFSIGAGGNGPQIVPPAGQTVLNSPDIQACATESQSGGSSG